MSKVAYLVLTHQDPVQLRRLIGALDHRASFFVHVDAKTDLRPFVERGVPSSVHFLEDRTPVYWAGYSMVRAILSLMEKALVSDEEFTHLVLLSGADYPVKPAAAIVDHLTSQPNREFIKYIDMRNSADHYMVQVQRKHFRDPVLTPSSPTRRFFDRSVRRVMNAVRLPNVWDAQVVPYFGSTWWALTPGCCRHIVTMSRRGSSFVQMNERTFSPDEHFFHTLVGNSKYAENADGLQDYLGVGTCNMANLHIIDPTLAKWFTIADREEVARSDRYFVRKVRTGISDGLLDFIDAELLKGNV
jgi:hypothetical protein